MLRNCTTRAVTVAVYERVINVTGKIKRTMNVKPQNNLMINHLAQSVLLSYRLLKNWCPKKSIIRVHESSHEYGSTLPQVLSLHFFSQHL